MYTIEKFKELYTKQFEANHIGDTNTFLDLALVAPDLYVCFENVFNAINNAKDVDPVCKKKFNKLSDVLLLFKAINKNPKGGTSPTPDVELERLLTHAIICFDHITKDTPKLSNL